MKKFLFTILTMGTAIAFSSQAHAAALLLNNAPKNIAQQQQFYVDVAIDPQGKSLNGIQGSVVFSADTLSFVRAETGNSDVTLFVDRPTLNGNAISFSGVIPGGFDGLINPYDPKNRLPGQIVRLVFVGKAAGEAQIIATGTTITANDGQGTIETVPDQQAFLAVSTAVVPSIYTQTDTRLPTLTASIVKEDDLYGGKYALLFNAVDKESGIDRVEIKEGNDAWKVVQSPYLLRDQSRKSILLIRAFDVAGNASTIVTIPPTNQSQSPAVIVIVLILFALCIGYVIYKKRIQKNDL